MSALTDAEKEVLANVGITSPEQHNAGTVGWLNAKDRIATIERIVAEREVAAKAEALREAADADTSRGGLVRMWLRQRADRIEAGQ